MNLHYDKQGNPISMEEWVVLFEDFDNRVVGKSETAAGCLVSTVWLGLDHSFGEGPPLIFETLAYCDHLSTNEMERYATLEEAQAGHTRWVEFLENLHEALEEEKDQE